jgi:histidinol-phosphate aminotransferase
MSHLARAAIRELTPYSSARDEAEHGEIWLDANESPWDGPLNRYPEPQPRALVAALAELYGVAPEAMVVGRGVDEAIDLLVRVFCESGRDGILICPPTYGMYEVAAHIQGAAVERVPLDRREWLPDVDAILAAWQEHLHLVILCSPNNPTGRAVPRETVDRLCRELAGRALVVVDEAYVELCPERSVVNLLPAHENLVVLRTLSKAWALAGARCGAALAAPAIAELLHKARAPYPLAQPVVAAVLGALADRRGMQERVAVLVAERQRLADELMRLSGVERVFTSDANFLLVQVRNPDWWLSRCRSGGIVIRDRSGVVDRGLRISVGTPTENRALVAALLAGEPS